MPLNIMERVNLLKTLGRPTIFEYLPLLFTDIIELKGDRYFADDPAVYGAVCLYKDIPITVIAQVRARSIEELIRVNYSMPHPEGYRKAIRLARQAEKFKRPVLCFIDTPGAYCGVGAEERGQGEAIGSNLRDFMLLETPVISLVLGEGGSGGALGIGVADELAMLENALYSVVSPKGFASILWKDASREREAAELMKITAEDLYSYGVCDSIIAEPEGGAVNDIAFTAEGINKWLDGVLDKLLNENYKELPEKRYQKFRKMGLFK